MSIKQMELGLWSDVHLEPGKAATLVLWPGTVFKLHGSFTMETVASNTVRLTMLEESDERDFSATGAASPHVG